MRAVVLALAAAMAVGTSVGVAGTPAPAGPDVSRYTFRLPVIYPLAYQRWREIVPKQFESEEWLSHLQGVSDETTVVALNGGSMIYGWACKPHECGDNHVSLLANADGSRVVALVHFSYFTVKPDKTIVTDYALLVLGEPNPVELTCLEILDRSTVPRPKAC